MSAPVLSCVMPTRNRPEFVRQALQYFARQTFASRELIVVDDSDEPVEPLCAGPGVRYLRVGPGKLSLGAKLNLGIEIAAGEFIIKWDDDDWYRADFAATMLAALQAAPELDQVVAACGCYRLFLAGERCFRFAVANNGGGGTLTFTKALWLRVPFRDVNCGEDLWLRTDVGRPLVLVDESEIYVVIRHGRNTFVQRRDGRPTDEFLRSLPQVSTDLLCTFPPEDAAFYLALPAIAAKRKAAPRAPSSKRSG